MKKFTRLALLSFLVVLLQLIGNTIFIGQFSITLVLRKTEGRFYCLHRPSVLSLTPDI